MEKNKRSRIRAMQIDSIRGLLSIRRMDRVPYAQIRDVRSDEGDERTDESVFRWFSHIEIMGNHIISKLVYVSSRLVGRPRKKWIDSLNDCLKKSWMLRKEGGRCIVGMNGWSLQMGMLGG